MICFYVVEHETGVDFENDGTLSKPQCFNQAQLDNLTNDLALSKKLAELLASSIRLKEKTYLSEKQ